MINHFSWNKLLQQKSKQSDGLGECGIWKITMEIGWRTSFKTKDVPKYLKVNITACILCVSYKCVWARSHLLVPHQPLQQLQETSAITKVWEQILHRGLSRLWWDRKRMQHFEMNCAPFCCSCLAVKLGEISAHCSFTNLILLWVEFLLFSKLEDHWEGPRSKKVHDYSF